MKLFQIYEEDLAELERILPELQNEIMYGASMTNKIRVQLRRIRSLLSAVRWNYGPPNEIQNFIKEEKERREEKILREAHEEPEGVATRSLWKRNSEIPTPHHS